MVRRLILLNIVAILAIAILCISTNPERLPAALFIAFFVALYAACYATLALLSVLLCMVGVIASSRRRINHTALAVACLPVFLLVLQSIGQLTVKDVLLTLGLFVLLYLYFGRVLTKTSSDN